MPSAADLAALVLRLTAGVIFVAQGYTKLIRPAEVAHGRANLEAMIRARGLPRSRQIALIVSGFELLGGIALLAGILTRLAIVPLAAILVVAIIGFKFRSGFLGGWDWPLSVLAILVAIALLGPGLYSVDAILGLQ